MTSVSGDIDDFIDPRTRLFGIIQRERRIRDDATSEKRLLLPEVTLTTVRQHVPARPHYPHSTAQISLDYLVQLRGPLT